MLITNMCLHVTVDITQVTLFFFLLKMRVKVVVVTEFRKGFLVDYSSISGVGKAGVLLRKERRYPLARRTQFSLAMAASYIATV